MMPGKFAPLALPLLLLCACSHTPRPNAKPDWVDGQSADYPAARYLTGRGEAASEAVARDRARADLAKSFSVKINARSKDVAAYAKDAGQPASNKLDVSRHVTTSTDALVRGARIAATWRDPATRIYHAFAVLSRPETAAALRQRIARLDAETGSRLKQARAANDLLDKIAASDKAVTAQTKRARLQRQLRVVAITGRGSVPSWNLGRLQADRAELLSRLAISAAATGRNAAAVKEALAGALANAGFTVRRDAPYSMTASLDYHALGKRNGWYWMTGTLSIALRGRNGARGTRQWPLKASATDPVLARQRLMKKVAEHFNRHIRDATLHFAGAGEEK
jgi:hypothetical protein